MELTLSVTQSGQGFSFARHRRESFASICNGIVFSFFGSASKAQQKQSLGVCALRGELGNSSTLPLYAGKPQNCKILDVLAEPVLSARGEKKKKMQGKGET